MMGVDRAQSAAASLIDWWALAGVSHTVSETPVNWLAPIAGRDAAASSAPVHAPLADVASARALMPETLDAFHAWLARDTTLVEAQWPQLDAQARRVLPAGTAAPRLMVIADFPDADDLATGKLLSGEAGRLFEAMLGALGQARDSVYLASLAVSRPAGGLLSDQDAMALAERMRHHVALVGPQHVMLIGDKTSRALLPMADPVNPLGLRALNLGRATVDAIGIAHPRFLLKHPSAKAQCWRTMQILLEAMA
ncbi:uracil-DNA glycosylase family protein [Sphingobium algorifonticola]|nr:uracil-DNA glycosylase family protein [Sphingobium algorifonticola]